MLACFAFSGTHHACAQAPDTTSRVQVDSAFNHALGLYAQATESSQYLYNGSDYFIYDGAAEEHQFFESEDWEEGSLVYDGRSYSSLPMLYDLVTDKVIIQRARPYPQVQLQAEKVATFTLLNHTFIRLTDSDSGLKTGFYDQLYHGYLQVVAKRKKERKSIIKERREIIEFPARNAFYVRKDGVYHAVKSKKALFRLLADQQKALKKYVREKKIDFSKDRESAIARVTAYYDQLTHP